MQTRVTYITHPNNTWNHFLEIPIAVILTTYDTWDDPPNTYCSPPVSAAPLEGFPKSLSLVFLEVAVEVEVSPGIDGPLLGTHISEGSWEDDFVLFQWVGEYFRYILGYARSQQGRSS